VPEEVLVLNAAFISGEPPETGRGRARGFRRTPRRSSLGLVSRLAPAFDLNPFPDRVRELNTWISPDTGPEATVDALLSVAPYFKIQKARAKGMLAQVERAVAGWRDEGRSIGMSDAELEPFAPAFEHAEREAARGL
jgi:hypothetical protein